MKNNLFKYLKTINPGFLVLYPVGADSSGTTHFIFLVLVFLTMLPIAIYFYIKKVKKDKRRQARLNKK